MGINIGNVERLLIIRVPVWNAKDVALYPVSDDKIVVIFKLYKCTFLKNLLILNKTK